MTLGKRIFIVSTLFIVGCKNSAPLPVTKEKTTKIDTITKVKKDTLPSKTDTITKVTTDTLSSKVSPGYIPMPGNGLYLLNKGTITFTSPDGTYTFTAPTDSIFFQNDAPEMKIIVYEGYYSPNHFVLRMIAPPKVGINDVWEIEYDLQNRKYSTLYYNDNDVPIGQVEFEKYNSDSTLAKGTFNVKISAKLNAEKVTGTFNLLLNKK